MGEKIYNYVKKSVEYAKLFLSTGICDVLVQLQAQDLQLLDQLQEGMFEKDFGKKQHYWVKPQKKKS